MRAEVAPAFAAAIILLASCSNAPNAYPPPAQIALPSGPEPAVTIDTSHRLLLAMSDPDAGVHIVAGVFASDAGSEWRFTGLHPRFRFDVARQPRLSFYIRFYNHGEALRARGPVSFSVSIDGNRFQSPRFSASGDQEYRRPIPDSWIARPGPVDISLDVDPPWHSPDGETYGVLLNSIGFEKP